MILAYNYLANGHKPQLILGLGFIVRRSGTDAAVVVAALDADYIRELFGADIGYGALHGPNNAYGTLNGPDTAARDLHA